MDSTSLTIIGTIILIICIVPFVAMSRSRKKREEIFIKALVSLASRSNCKISQYEIWNRRAIGIDNDARKIFFIKKTEDIFFESEISLPEMERCHVVKVQRAVRNGNENFDVMDRLELTFDYRDRKNSAFILDFYNTNKDSLTPSDELQVGNKWAAIANASIEMAKRSQTKQQLF